MTPGSDTAVPSPADLVRRYVADPTSAWSIGTYGALGEFLRDPDETSRFEESPRGATVVTGRGALRAALDEAVRVVAFETPTRRPDGWSQGVAFCLPGADAAVTRRDTLTELGPDAGALRPEDREAVLFDLGLSLPHVEACIRIADAALAGALRPHVGGALLAGGNPAIGIIKEGQPHRVFRSRLGRLEVYQPIAPAAKGSRTPEGPHTHLLPHLLAERRTHGPGVPVPTGYLPCLMLHPASPISDDLGRPIPFDAARHEAFQALMNAFGDDDFVAEKARVWAAVRGGTRPDGHEPPVKGRAGRALRIALRQLARTDPELPGLAAWRAAFDGSRVRTRAPAGRLRSPATSRSRASRGASRSSRGSSS